MTKFVGAGSVGKWRVPLWPPLRMDFFRLSSASIELRLYSIAIDSLPDCLAAEPMSSGRFISIAERLATMFLFIVFDDWKLWLIGSCDCLYGCSIDDGCVVSSATGC